jgi:hypothetical protein
MKPEVCEIGSNTSQTATKPLPICLTEFIQFHKQNAVPNKGDQRVMIIEITTQLHTGTTLLLLVSLLANGQTQTYISM